MCNKVVLFEYEGKNYYKFGELSKRFNVPSNIISNRVRKLGWSMERALGLEGKYSVGDNFFKSIREISEFYDVPTGLITNAISKGRSIEVALGLKTLEDDVVQEMYGSREKYGPRGVVFRGVPYDSLSALARAYGIDRHQLYGRHVKLKWTLEQALLLEEKPGFTYMVEGKMYVGLRNLARAYGISSETVRNRMDQLNWSLYEALGIVPRPVISEYKKIGKVCYGNREYSKLTELCEEYEISYKTVLYFRNTKNISIVEAIDCARELEHRRKNGLTVSNAKYVVFGEPFNSLSAVAKRHGITREAIEHRIQLYGMDLESAVLDAKETYVPGKSRGIIVNYYGKDYHSLKELTIAYKSDYGKFLKLRKSGMSIRESLSKSKI